MNFHILTDWFPAHVKPEYPGVYEKDFGLKGPNFQYWDGNLWYYGSNTPEKTYKVYKHYLSGVYAEPSPRRWRGITTGWFLVKDYQPLTNEAYHVYTPEYSANTYSRFENGIWHLCAADKNHAASYTMESTDMLGRGAMFKIYDDGLAHPHQISSRVYTDW